MKAPFHTLNELSPETEHVWIVCHGYGQLSRRFIAQFDHLDPTRHFIVSLQGLSKFYLPNHRHVGASWMTREDREIDLNNQREYFESVYRAFNNGRDWHGKKIHLLGFSQGASAICRFAAYLQVDFHDLILWAGSFPPELSTRDFEYLRLKPVAKGVLADQDEYYSKELFEVEVEKLEMALGLTASKMTYEGTHQLDRRVISSVLN